MSLILPQHYKLKLLPETTEVAIKLIKDSFQQLLSENLNLRRVTAPLFVTADSGLNDNLNGTERPVTFNVTALGGREMEIVHSLAKWKRAKLADYDIEPGYGLYTDMNALRVDEELDNIHSIYVDQWDWEQTISPEMRTTAYLHSTVQKIYDAIKATERLVFKTFPHITPQLPDKLTFIHSQELLNRYPHLSPRQREAAIAREVGAVFITGIGAPLSDGTPHDHRAPDYDDWTTPNEQGFPGLNGDLVVWNRVLQIPFELSSMGIRVDAPTMLKQLEAAGCKERSCLPFHRSLLQGQLPLSIGGGIGQSRLCMLLLQKAHIGEVQVSCWPESHIAQCRKAGITLL